MPSHRRKLMIKFSDFKLKGEIPWSRTARLHLRLLTRNPLAHFNLLQQDLDLIVFAERQ
jgi:hypothetical protein